MPDFEKMIFLLLSRVSPRPCVIAMDSVQFKLYLTATDTAEKTPTVNRWH